MFRNFGGGILAQRFEHFEITLTEHIRRIMKTNEAFDILSFRRIPQVHLAIAARPVRHLFAQVGDETRSIGHKLQARSDNQQCRNQ
uniref:Uncharacterized protein n=1 Tax=Romanomermis culicivorax TaxID=13658 RepID=A0A915KTY6_ROMCU